LRAVLAKTQGKVFKDVADTAKSASNPLFKVGEAAPDVTLLDENGQQVRLASLWQQKPTLLTFIRHYG
jgi:cytochrome oxidase Cu insertion factor (SCO1/SenC/PrrC family)